MGKGEFFYDVIIRVLAVFPEDLKQVETLSMGSWIVKSPGRMSSNQDGFGAKRQNCSVSMA